MLRRYHIIDLDDLRRAGRGPWLSWRSA